MLYNRRESFSCILILNTSIYLHQIIIYCYYPYVIIIYCYYSYVIIIYVVIITYVI